MRPLRAALLRIDAWVEGHRESMQEELPMPPPLLHCDEAGDATASCPSGGRRLSPVLLPISRAPPRALPPLPGIVPPLALPRDPQGCSLPDDCDASITGAPGEGEESHGGGMLEMFGRWLGSRSPRGPRNGMANEAAGMAGIASRRLHASPDNGHQLHREQEMLRESDCPHDVNPPLMPTTESEWRGAPFGDSVAGASGPSTMDDGYWNSVFSGTSSSLSPLRPEVMNLAGSLAPLHGSPSRAPKHHRPKGHDQNAFKWKPPPTPPHAAAAQPAALAGALWQALASPRGMRQRGFRRRYRPEAGDIDNDDRYSSADSSGDGPVAGGMVPELEFQESDFLLSPEDWAKLMAMQEEDRGNEPVNPSPDMWSSVWSGADTPQCAMSCRSSGRSGADTPQYSLAGSTSSCDFGLGIREGGGYCLGSRDPSRVTTPGFMSPLPRHGDDDGLGSAALLHGAGFVPNESVRNLA